MRAFSVVLIVAALSFAQESPLSAVAKLEKMPYAIMAYGDSLDIESDKAANELLRQRLFQMFDSSLAGEALTEAKQDVDDGLAKGWTIANTNAFDWVFPHFPHRVSAAKVVSNNGLEAVVEYRSRFLNTLVLEEDSISQELKGIYQDFRVTSPPLKQLLSEAKISGDFVYHVRSDCLATFYLKKTPAGWRVVDWEESIVGSQMLAEG
jgi:hypothetical protein